MEIIKNGDMNHLEKYTTFTCPVCRCKFKVDIDHQDTEFDLTFDHISSTCPQCKTPVRNYFTDPEVAPIVRVYYYKKLEHQQESNLAELNDRMKKTFNESFKSAMNDVIMAREQFERNHKARMAEFQKAFDNLAESYEDQKEIDQKIKENQKALEDLLK